MKKIKDSFAGVLIGFILIIVGIGLLWWNEGNNVKNIKTVDELLKNYVDIENSPIKQENDDKLVAVNGKMNILDGELTDKEFNVSINGAKLERIVEMYQWDEEEHEDDDKTTYSYKKVWSDDRIDSSSFHNSDNHRNPEMPYSNEDYSATKILVGDFSLSSKQIKSLSASDDLKLDSSMEYKQGYVVKNGKYLTNSSDLENPRIGDIRIHYEYPDYDEVSILAVQKGNTFVDYVSKVGKTTNKVMRGLHNGKDIINSIQDDNNSLKWILRLCGALAIVFGIMTVFGPISTLTSFVPILGGVVGTAVFMISLLLGGAISLVVIAISWIFYRPLLGILLLAGAILLTIIISYILKKNKANS